jgi:hypothetical protein
MSLNVSMILSQLENGEEIEKLFDLTQSPEARWDYLQELIHKNKRWRDAVKTCLLAKENGISDGEILDGLINQLELHFGSLKLNSRFLRASLPPEKIAAYEQVFSQALTLYSERAAQSKPKRKRIKR